jgi:hypothetical protein
MKLVVITGDPRIIRIDKIFSQNGPIFLDLYASIYGNLIFRLKKVRSCFIIGDQQKSSS